MPILKRSNSTLTAERICVSIMLITTLICAFNVLRAGIFSPLRLKSSVFTSPVLDMEWYLDKFNSTVSKTVTVKRRTTYPKQQQKLFDVITYWVNVEKSYKISTDSLFSRAKLKLARQNKDMAISRLNKYYQEINNTTITLVKKSKKTGYYEISKDFQLDREN